MPESAFAWPVRVYYEDTDAAGIVYHANYLRFMERARTEWLRALGYAQDHVRRTDGVVFVITAADVHFTAPARFDDELIVTTRLERLRRASMTLHQVIDARDGRHICEARNSVACIDARNFSPCRIPPDMLKDLERAQ